MSPRRKRPATEADFLDTLGEWYDRHGERITFRQYAALTSDFETNCRVAKDVIVEGLVEVSTVWLGNNHRFAAGAPIIFETLVFGGSLDGDGERYETEAEALAGHARWVERARVASEQSQ